VEATHLLARGSRQHPSCGVNASTVEFRLTSFKSLSFTLKICPDPPVATLSSSRLTAVSVVEASLPAACSPLAIVAAAFSIHRANATNMRVDSRAELEERASEAGTDARCHEARLRQLIAAWCRRDVGPAKKLWARPRGVSADSTRHGGKILQESTQRLAKPGSN